MLGVTVRQTRYEIWWLRGFGCALGYHKYTLVDWSIAHTINLGIIQLWWRKE